jgi:hypothetical protein
MSVAQDVFEAKTEFYQELVRKAARAKGFRSIEELKEDLKNKVDDVDKDNLNLFESAEEGLSEMHKTVGSLAFLCLGVGISGDLAMKKKFGANICEYLSFRSPIFCQQQRRLFL